MKYLGNFLARFYFVQYIYMHAIDKIDPREYLDFLNEIFILDDFNSELFFNLINAYNLYGLQVWETILATAKKQITDSILQSCLIAGGVELLINKEKNLVISEYIKIGKDFDIQIGILNKILEELSKIEDKSKTEVIN